MRGVLVAEFHYQNIEVAAETCDPRCNHQLQSIFHFFGQFRWNKYSLHRLPECLRRYAVHYILLVLYYNQHIQHILRLSRLSFEDAVGTVIVGFVKAISRLVKVTVRRLVGQVFEILRGR